jgi:hypothetical protein
MVDQSIGLNLEARAREFEIGSLKNRLSLPGLPSPFVLIVSMIKDNGEVSSSH